MSFLLPLLGNIASAVLPQIIGGVEEGIKKKKPFLSILGDIGKDILGLDKINARMPIKATDGIIDTRPLNGISKAISIAEKVLPFLPKKVRSIAEKALPVVQQLLPRRKLIEDIRKPRKRRRKRRRKRKRKRRRKNLPKNRSFARVI